MKLFALFAAVFAQRAENFRQIVNKIPDTFSPTAKTSTFSGAGSIQFTTSSFDKKQENLVLVWSEDGQFSSPFNIIANIRPAHSEFEKFDSEFSDKVSFTFPSDSSVDVSISVDESDSRFFYVLSFSDPFSSSDVTHTGDDFSHRANFYLGELQAGYLDVNTMIAAQQTTNGVLGDNGITVSDDLVYRPATQEELEKIGFQGPGIAVDMPNDDWFAAHRSAEYVTFATDYSSAKLMRPKNKEDVVANTKAVLEGWEVEISCGPIPEGDQSTMEVSIEARTESDEHQSFRAPVSELIVGDKISKKVKVESWHQSTGVWCKFFEGGNLIGYTNPQTFVVNAPAELPAITATYNSPKCGFVGAGAEEEIATCAAASATFPPLFLQWKVIKADGTEVLIPAEPKETFSLKLPVVISQEYAGASASCSVYQGTDPALKSAPEFQKSVTPTGSGFSLKKKTSKLDMHVIGRDVTCQSDVFGATTVAEDECSDVQSIEVTNTVNCPLETFYKQATCRIVLVGGGVPLESTYTNEECIATVDELYEEVKEWDATTIVLLSALVIGLLAGVIFLFWCLCCRSKASNSDEQDLEDPLTPRLPNKDSVVIRKNLSIYEADKRISKLPDMNEESILLSSGNHEQLDLEDLNREEPKSPPPPLIEDESEDESKIENL